MKEITEAIKTKQAQIRSLEADVEALQRAARALGGTQATRRPKAQRQAKPKAKAKPKARAKARRTMSATERKAVSQRMKKYWAERRKAKKFRGVATR